ncbi:MAG: hypothetical protein AAB887_01115 [Patescibacteria group bacterium]
MKFVPGLLYVLGKAVDEGNCLTNEQIYRELGVEDPDVKFKVSGAMEGLVAIDLIGEAENSGGGRVYYPKRRENELIKQGVLSAKPHMYVTALDEDGGINSLRVDGDKISGTTWNELSRGNKEAILLVARFGLERGGSEVVSLVTKREKGR